MFRHPVHPLLVHFPIVLWTLSTVVDGFVFFKIDQWLVINHLWSASCLLLSLGCAAGLLTIVSGFIDLMNVKEKAQNTANIHMSIMCSTWLVYVFALYSRLDRQLDKMDIIAQPDLITFALSAAGFVLMLIGGWFGAQLVYTHGVGVKIQDQ
ncbi:MAG: DUF2231 domain-containing protein [Hyphomicrobiales bacterium]